MNAKKQIATGVAVTVVLVAFLVLIWPQWREASERAKAEQRESQTQRILEAQKTRVLTQCRSIVQAIEAYKTAPGNPMNEPPESFQNLVAPPFGGTGFLKNGAADLVDLWGNRLQVAHIAEGGSKFVLIYTHAPDGTPVSQYGIGAESRVPAK